MDLIPYIEAYQQRPDPWFAVIVWACGTVIGPSFSSVRRVIKASLRVIPYTADATEDLIRDYAAHLGPTIWRLNHSKCGYTWRYTRSGR